MDQANKKGGNHPTASYLIGSIFIGITLVVFVGVLYHLTFSTHGPQLLIPLKKKYFTKQQSTILTEARRLEEFEIHRHFHNIVEFPQIPENLRSVCFICHSDYPHSKNKKVRSLLNMHTQYFVCETCHIKEKKETMIVYKWYNPLNDNPNGPFFGTSYDPQTGNIMEVEDMMSKMTPYFKTKDKIEAAIQVQDAPLAQDYMKVRDKLTPEQRDGVKKKFHVNIKPRGHECNTCHTKNGILDFKKLGFAENRIVDLEQLNVKGMITKYEKFYLPDLFKETKAKK
ncbi:MAG: hypothetical protein GWP06_18635 [Actinobacteria bacterium]|nr:hypothetical protein [Actinomycetota bacterium]